MKGNVIIIVVLVCALFSGCAVQDSKTENNVVTTTQEEQDNTKPVTQGDTDDTKDEFSYEEFKDIINGIDIPNEIKDVLVNNSTFIDGTSKKKYIITEYESSKKAEAAFIKTIDSVDTMDFDNDGKNELIVGVNYTSGGPGYILLRENGKGEVYLYEVGERFAVGNSGSVYCSGGYDVGAIMKLSFENDELKEGIIASKEKKDGNYIYYVSKQIATEEEYNALYEKGGFYIRQPLFVYYNFN